MARRKRVKYNTGGLDLSQFSNYQPGQAGFNQFNVQGVTPGLQTPVPGGMQFNAGAVQGAAGLAQPVAQIVGGDAGSALSGAASGAAAGSLLGPVGAVAGGVLGLAGSLIGSDRRKREQRKAKRRAEKMQREGMYRQQKLSELDPTQQYASTFAYGGNIFQYPQGEMLTGSEEVGTRYPQGQDANRGMSIERYADGGILESSMREHLRKRRDFGNHPGYDRSYIRANGGSVPPLDEEVDVGVTVELEHAPTLEYIKRYHKEHGKFPSEKQVAKSVTVDHLKDFKKIKDRQDPSYYMGLVNNKLTDELSEYAGGGFLEPSDTTLESIRSMAKGGGLSRSEDYGSKNKPYPSVKSGDFAGGDRSYPIPTRADAVDALRLAGLHGRSDVRAKVYKKYPGLKKKASGGGIDHYAEGGKLREYSEKEVEYGTKEEMEHTTSKAKARQIAEEHLAEHSDYYTRLKGAGLADSYAYGGINAYYDDLEMIQGMNVGASRKAWGGDLAGQGLGVGSSMIGRGANAYGDYATGGSKGPFYRPDRRAVPDYYPASDKFGMMEKEPDNFTEFNGGGTHEQNPYGGIPVGKKASVEHGEVKYDSQKYGSYIFSNRF